ncbi:MAG: globin [Pseudomonadota bacterium]
MTLYDVAGGYDRLHEMTTAFYAKALKDDLIGDMFSKAASEHAHYLAGWLSASFGGPTDYLTERGDIRFVIWKHAALHITEAQRARWARLMLDAAAEVAMPEAFMRSYERFVDSITRSVRENSNMDIEIMRAELGLAPGEDLYPRQKPTS